MGVENTEEAIKNGQSRETGNIGHKKQMKDNSEKLVTLDTRNNPEKLVTLDTRRR